ncbi:MAG TPA: hypothetical protein VF959_08240, partial [Casimicrobiaceae bacterium]
CARAEKECFSFTPQSRRSSLDSRCVYLCRAIDIGWQTAQMLSLAVSSFAKDAVRVTPPGITRSRRLLKQAARDAAPCLA